MKANNYALVEIEESDGTLGPRAVSEAFRMSNLRRTIRGRWTAFAAVVAVLFASDARLSHFSTCTESPGLSDFRASCKSSEFCCPYGPSLSASETPTCFVLDSCDCRAHTTPPHQGEQYRRSPVDRNPLKVQFDLGLAWDLPSIDPPSLATRLARPVPGPFSDAFRVLRCHHLLI